MLLSFPIVPMEPALYSYGVVQRVYVVMLLSELWYARSFLLLLQFVGSRLLLSLLVWMCNIDVFSVVNMYLDHLKLYVVCINGRRQWRSQGVLRPGQTIKLAPLPPCLIAFSFTITLYTLLYTEKQFTFQWTTE